VTSWWLPLTQSGLLADLRYAWRYCDTIQMNTQATIVDETAFRYFYDRTGPALRAYLRMLCKDTTLADDWMQEIYYRFLRVDLSDLNEFQMKAYLYKIATSVARDHWRAEKRQRHRQEAYLLENEPVVNPNLAQDMNQLLKKLDPRQKTLLWLAYVEGFRHREIAETLGIKENSVRVLLSRARRQLTVILTQSGLNPKER
jgi:RNA polymerase sigma-70 factor (ECF subfamily)